MHRIEDQYGKITTTSSLMVKIVGLGYEIVPLPGKKIVMFFNCPKCKETRMFKAHKAPDKRNKLHICICGHRHTTPKRASKHSTFIHV